MRALCQQSGYTLDAINNIWIKPAYEGIAYNDGDEIEKRIASIIQNASDLSVLSSELRRQCTDWPSLYHLSGTRANIMRPFETILKGDILEIGAGCGAITRYLGECGANVLALEGSPRRAAIARSRTHDLGNVTVLAERFDRFQCDRRFDVITLIGVLEYANLFTSDKNAPLAMLERVRALLKPEGKLIIAIENQLGLKYFAGAPEDHLGQPMIGIEGRYREDQPKTFGRATLANMLEQAGFIKSEFLAPFPDYKLPVSILTENGISSKDFDASALAWQSARRDPQLPAFCNFSLELTWPEVFQNELGLDLANSFLIITSPEAKALIDTRILAYHYSTDRVAQYCKETVFKRAEYKDICVRYRTFYNTEITTNDAKNLLIKFTCQDTSKYVLGMPLSLEFIRLLTKDGWSFDQVGRLIRHYLSIVETFANSCGIQMDMASPYEKLPGEFFDVLPQNIIVRRDDGSPALIDREWQLVEPLEIGFLLFRSFLWLISSVTRFGRPASNEKLTYYQFIDSAFSAAGFRLEDDDYARYISLEAKIQQIVTGRSEEKFLSWWKDQPLSILNLSQALTERNEQVTNLTHAITKCDEQINDLIAEHNEQINNLTVERDAIVRSLVEIRRSSSWRITAPLRFVGHLIQGNHDLAGNVVREFSRRMMSGIPTRVTSFVSLYYGRLQSLVGVMPNSSANQAAITAIVNQRCAFSEALRVDPLSAPTPQAWAEIDISIVTYNSSRWITNFVDSLIKLDYPKSLVTVRFVDNSSTDSTFKDLHAVTPKLRAAGFAVETMQRPNHGYGAGHNAAIFKGTSPFCLVTNVDITLESDALRRIVAVALADNERAAAWELRQKPYEHPKFYDPITGTTNWNSHACVLLRRSALEQVGGYDETLFMYGEDVELSYRLRRAGFLLRYCPQAVVWHYSYESPNQIKPIQYIGSTFANLYLRLKYGNRIDALAVPMLGLRLLLAPEVYSGSRRDVLLNLLKLGTVTPKALLRRRSSDAYFPFRTWDYELSREGAFVEQQSLPLNPPLVSIITRTYRGRELYLRQALLSVAHQTYPNIEHIVVEDGGETMRPVVDNISQIVGRAIHFIKLDKLGRSAAGNAGLSAAKGHWCLFLDDDDLLFSDHVEVLASALLNQADAVAAYTLAWEVITDSSRLMEGSYSEVAHRVPLPLRQNFDYEVLKHHNFITIQSVLFERRLFEERGGFEVDMDALEDWVLWKKYARGNWFRYVPKVTSLYRTPANPFLISKRQEAFDTAYPLALVK
jgi:GT2 family glycosyltransferase/2-polyprenyl-3-methyl-5-hydroxy-6-metoxy-1,4-benzoquinol methylase